MKEHQRVFATGRLAALACGMAMFAGGCGGSGNNETFESVSKSQQSARAEWEKAKAEGRDKSGSPVKAEPRQGYSGGHVNKPGI